MDLTQRIAGKLPQIEIAGTMFFVDVRLRELRADHGLKSRICLDQLETGPDGESYRFAFNTETKQLVEVDRKITEWPKNVLIVEIPSDIKLDSYSVAMKNGLDPVAFVSEHPIEKDLKAKIIPLSETELPAMMKRNKKAKEQKLLTKSGSLNKKNKGNRIQ
jgi:hypothetical protein